MRFAPLAIAAASLSVSAAHGTHHSQHAHLHKRAAGSTLITTGAKGLGDSQVHTRLEISDLAQRPEQWALFIQAMDKFQEAGSANVTGYYSIASIHGVPRQDWDGVPQCDSCGGADGYCPHDSVLFPAWHRAYMALYEQEFINFAFEVASSYPDDKRDAMLSAASTIRFPYWDWAAKPDSGSVLPTIMASPQVSYEGPNGQETINNPLYDFSIPDPSAMYYGPFNSWPSTLRWPNSNNADAQSQDDSCVGSFDSIRSNMADSVYNLLTVCNDYLHFSNDNAGSGASTCTNSIEGIHNTIHTTSGGPGANGVSGGHMTYLPLAAFDPLFWLHHCNVDRMFALWQTINPDSYGASQTAPHNTWTIASGSQQGPDSPLEPFRKDASSFWTTNDVRDWESTFSYTYPEFSTSDGSRDSIIKFVNALYGPDASLSASSISEEAEQNQSNASASSTTSAVASSTSASSYTSSGTSSTSAASSAITSPVTSIAGTVAASSSAASSVSENGLGGIGSIVSGMEGTVSSVLSGVESAVAGSISGVGSIGQNGASSVGGLIGTLGSKVTATRTGSLGSLTTGIAGAINSTLGGITGGSQVQYGCNINTPRYALNGSYYVYVFDGQPASSDASQYLTDKNLIGAVGVLGGGEMTANISISGSVPLTRYLQGKVSSGVIPNLSQNVTGPYLAKQLNWKIVQGSQEIHPSVLGGFQASVYSAKSAASSNDLLPVWSALQPVVEATKGKAGGLQSSAGWSSSSSSSSSGGACPSSVSQGNGTAPAYQGNATAPAYSPSQSKVPTGTPMAVPTSYSTTGPSAPSYTGAANRASFGVAGVLAVAGLVAML